MLFSEVALFRTDNCNILHSANNEQALIEAEEKKGAATVAARKLKKKTIPK